jgi:hypothetical protein
MNKEDASEEVRKADNEDHAQRTERLIELMNLLPENAAAEFSGEAARWLFADVKATWIHQFFASTVLTAYAFCLVQLSGMIRMRVDGLRSPETPASLEHLATAAFNAGLIDVEVRAKLVDLQDRWDLYTPSNRFGFDTRLDRHLAEAATLGGEHPLITDARGALEAAVLLAYVR